MAEYLQKVGGVWRVLSGIAVGFAGAGFLILFLVFTIEGGPKDFGKAHTELLTIVFAGFGAVGTLALFIAVRLLWGSASANGVTLVPTWAIQAFGLFFFTAILFSAVISGSVLSGAKGLPVALAMILIGRRIARHRESLPKTHP